jgi:hypothetical protein
MRGTLFFLLLCGMGLPLTGCSLVLPEISHQPVIRNPFPQLSRVAVAPFFNHSDEPTVDGREFALAYFAELQRTPGFEVVPLGVVEEAIITHRIELGGPGEARRLAQLLGVDAVVVGAITDYSPYYPPRCGLRVEWYTANPGFHEIPVGYGLPWHTPEEEFIPDSLAYEAKLSLARAQLATQSPACDEACEPLPQPTATPEASDEQFAPESAEDEESVDENAARMDELRLTQAQEELPLGESPAVAEEITSPPAAGTTGTGDTIAPLPAGWPDESCFAPPLPEADRPDCLPTNVPVLTHTRIYRGTDPELTEAIKSYVYFRDDARFGGWRSYLQRSDDFIRFCCHMHISEMLSARGGSRKTRVVWRWPDSR